MASEESKRNDFYRNDNKLIVIFFENDKKRINSCFVKDSIRLKTKCCHL